MIKRLLIPIFLILSGIIFISCSTAGDPDEVNGPGPQNTFIKKFGGSLSDFGESIIQTSDGGYVITGYTNSGDGDFKEGDEGKVFVLKLNPKGDKEWIKTFGGNGNDEGHSIIQTQDGGFALTGSTRSDDGDFDGLNKGGLDAFVIKLNQNGDLEWVRTIGGSDRDAAYSIIQSHGGELVITGSSSSLDGDLNTTKSGTLMLAKLSFSGDLLWVRTYGSDATGIGQSLIQSTDGGYTVTGWYFGNSDFFEGMNHGSSDIFVMKVNSAGDTEWVRTFGGSGPERGYSITGTPDNGYIMAGRVPTADGDFSGFNEDRVFIFLVKLDHTGNTEWLKSIGGNRDLYGLSIHNAIEDGFVLTGHTSSDTGIFTDSGNGNILVLKVSDHGESEWARRYGGYQGEFGYSAIPTFDNGYILTGSSQSSGGDFSGMSKGRYDIVVIKVDKNGNL